MCLGRCDRLLGRAGLLAAAIVAAAALGGCSLLGRPSALLHDDPQTITVTSPEFGQGRAIPAQYTCRGRGESPPVSWSNWPAGTKTLALVMDDADAPIAPFVYWIVFNINPQAPDIQSRSHQYRFTIYALNASLPLPEGTSLTAAVDDIASHALARGRLTGVITP